MPRFVGVGECIVELHREADSRYRLSFAGDAFNVARLIRRQLGTEWSVDLLTALGDDSYSQQIVDDLVAGGVGIGHVLKIPGRTVGLRLAESSSADPPIVTNWRSQSAARLLADDPETLRVALFEADLVYVTGSLFGVLAPRARGRLMRALHRARQAGSRIVLAPHEWPGVWTSRRVMGSAINAISMIADVIFTSISDEEFAFGDGDLNAIARRYQDWGVEEIFVWNPAQGVYRSSPASSHWMKTNSIPVGDDTHSAILATLAQGMSVRETASTQPGPGDRQ